MRQIRSGSSGSFLPKATSADNTNQAPAPARGFGGGATPAPTAELDAASKEAELSSHDDADLDLDNNKDDDNTSRRERCAVLKANLQRIRQNRSSGRPRHFLPRATSTDNKNQAPASGCDGGAGPVPTAELDAPFKEAAAEADQENLHNDDTAPVADTKGPGAAVEEFPSFELFEFQEKRAKAADVARAATEKAGNQMTTVYDPRMTAVNDPKLADAAVVDMMDGAPLDVKKRKRARR